MLPLKETFLRWFQRSRVYLSFIMGGCRCTYKNCSLKSDGVTHMFHYPVFDKVRCHQWLTNAQKLEFLNLKVSQLKNRVICQHHFNDDNFMNFLKDKLIFNAVPTLDGPYCDSSKLINQKREQDVSKLYSISLEDIENEYLTFNDKKANFSMKYGDFLTNCDLMDLDSMNAANDNTQITMKVECQAEPNKIILNDEIECQRVPPVNPNYNKGVSFPANDNNVIRVQVTEVPVQYETKVQGNVNIPNENMLQSHGPQNNIKLITHSPKTVLTKNSKASKKITIIDQKEILDPTEVPLPKSIKLEPICPSAILTLSNKRKRVNLNSQLKDNQGKLSGPDLEESTNMVGQVIEIENNVNAVQTVNVPEKLILIQNDVHSEISPISKTLSKVKQNVVRANKIPLQNSQVLSTSNVKHMVKDKKNNQSLLKSKIPPERMAAIEEKRKFNMKLRDIIASCLDKLDDEETNDYNSSKVKAQIENNITQKVSSYLSKDPELPSMQDYTVAYLEARMKKMEDILLHKIDQNSRRIVELQKSLALSVDKKVVHTQTTANEELQKKHLYQEISKFLSPQANSLLYEELFINKYAQKIQDHSPTKKRKNR
ncbi:unnamed protein product [Arctia plantaginis]|uniref:THAP-type domain-containing protein n=1 Tax=Arctia plantaginis TaxID=874455 RepID=A0A8S1BPB8_ARCPL|nr:unnamed protein product [Arctia plantaginis]